MVGGTPYTTEVLCTDSEEVEARDFHAPPIHLVMWAIEDAATLDYSWAEESDYDDAGGSLPEITRVSETEFIVGGGVRVELLGQTPLTSAFGPPFYYSHDDRHNAPYISGPWSTEELLARTNGCDELLGEGSAEDGDGELYSLHTADTLEADARGLRRLARVMRVGGKLPLTEGTAGAPSSTVELSREDVLWASHEIAAIAIIGVNRGSRIGRLLERLELMLDSALEGL
jgi:hypothetical protein